MRHIAIASVVAGTIFVLAGGGTAGAAPYALGTDVNVSTPLSSTLTSCPFGASADFAAAYDSTEVEPQVAVNPTDPDEMVGVTQQDRWPDGGARGLSSWMTSDGGTNWAKLADVPWSGCQGGPTRFGRVTDPWVSYDAAGNLYFIGQPIDSGALGISAISVTTWNGTEWKRPADPHRGRGPPHRERQGLDHRRSHARRVRVRDVDPHRASVGRSATARTPTGPVRQARRSR